MSKKIDNKSAIVYAVEFTLENSDWGSIEENKKRLAILELSEDEKVEYFDGFEDEIQKEMLLYALCFLLGKIKGNGK